MGDEDDALAVWARAEIERRAGVARPAPHFPKGGEWLNVSRPLSLESDLRGKIVLLDFWCYCCINCLHVLPDLDHLERVFEGRAFAVVGVHSAKFTNERDTGNIREAIVRHEIRHPVVNDGDFRIWQSYGVSSWPTLVLLGPDGGILGSLSGEGHRERLEALVDAALDHYEDSDLLDATPLPIRLERSSLPAGVLSYPGKVAIDAKTRRLYVADTGHDRILELELDGTFRRAWGNGEPGLVDGGPDDARFYWPQGMTVRDGVLWVADTENHAVRRIDLETGTVETVAGSGRQGYERHGTYPGGAVDLSSPWDVEFVGDTLYVAMAGTHQIWTIDPVTKTTSQFAGTGAEMRLDAPSRGASAFAQPSGLATDGEDLYVADSESSSVVRIDLSSGAVETLAGATDDPRNLFHFGDEDGSGPGKRFQHALGIVFHDGLLYVADTYNHKLKTLDPKSRAVTSRWGTGKASLSDDPPAFAEPGGLDVLDDVLYVADSNNHAIRTVDLKTGKVATLALAGLAIPMAAAREGGVGEEWPTVPGTEERTHDVVRVASGTPLRLTLRLGLLDGWKLTEGAPSALRVEAGGETLDASIAEEEVDFDLPPQATGATVIQLRILLYVCRIGGTDCRLVGTTLAVPLEIVPDGPTTAAVILPVVP